MASSESRPSRAPLPLPGQPSLVRRLLRPALVLVTLILVADALVGDNGLLEHVRESRRHAEVRRTLDRTRRENYALRDKARRLREQEPAAIEELARGELGMIKPGELLFIIKDAGPAAPVETPAPADHEPAR
jgi:cell division protein FtsB